MSVCPSPANLPLCGQVGTDMCCVCVCVSLTGKPALVRSCREGYVSVCPSPANLPLWGLVGRDMCCVCLRAPHRQTCLVQSVGIGCVFCVSLTGKPAPVRSCREGNVSVYPSPANLPLCDLVGRDMCCVCVCLPHCPCVVL